MSGFVRVVSVAMMLCISSGAFAAGAIAVDDEEGQHAEDVGYGIATGENSREEAGREAMRRCRSASNHDCRVVVRFDTCGAYAASRGHWGVGWGTTERRAENMALDQCGANCRIVISDCE